MGNSILFSDKIFNPSASITVGIFFANFIVFVNKFLDSLVVDNQKPICNTVDILINSGILLVGASTISGAFADATFRTLS